MTRVPQLRNVPLASHTTLGVGGPAARMAAPVVVDELRLLLRAAANEQTPVLVLGGGSNTLVSDAGFAGLVITPALYGIALEGHGDDQVRVRVGAGVEWDELVSFCVDERLAGIEALSGIPGRAGAAPIQNIGAYGAELSDVLEAVHAIDRLTGAEVRLPATLCGLGYRSSRFKGEWRERYVVTAIELLLRRGGAGQARYAELREALGLGEQSAAPGVEDVRRAVLALRKRKSMLLDAGDPNHRSAGSFFTNPVVSDEQLAHVDARVAAQAGETTCPRWAVTGGHKLSAAWLIEHAGFRRGHVEGRVGLSTRHALAIINRGDAAAADVIALAGGIRRAVRERLDVVLEPEPVFVGFDRPAADLLDRP